MEAAGSALDVAEAGADMYLNGVTVENAFQMAGGVGGFAGSRTASCFTEGTQIVVGAEYDENDVFVQYVTVNIEDIKVGDWVYSYDTLTGTVEQKEVTAVFVRESDHINYLTILDEQGREQVIETTDSHPFWVVTDNPDLSRSARSVVDENGMILSHENLEPGLNGFWVEAKDLQVGDVVLGANGELSTLVAAERVVFPDGIKVYNFTVDGNHNYFVIAKCDEFGQTCVLVHNAQWYEGTHKSGGASNLKRLGLDGVNLKGKSYATGKQLLTNNGFHIHEITGTGRISLINSKGTKVHYDPPGKHWHIEGKDGLRFSAKGLIVDKCSAPAHIKARS